MSIKKFYNDRYYHIRSFSLHAAVAIAISIVIYKWHDPSFYTFEFHPLRAALYFIAGIYAGGVSVVFIHNATHNSFPNKWLNELAGQIAGVHQLWGFMGWKVIHLFHHQYSDRGDRDPHPPKGKSFGQFLLGMSLGASRSISDKYREQWGTGRQTQILHRCVKILFPIVFISYLAFWFSLLGPEPFVFFYLPSLIWNQVMFAHINYYCHPLDKTTGETQATNLDESLYHKVSNAIWWGIYYHGNHHKKPQLFNPKKMKAKDA